jgi:hypothetical protein
MSPDLTVNLPLLIAGLAAVAGLGLLWWLVRRIGRRNRSVPEAAALWSGRAYRCPECGCAMAPGWVLLGKGAIWRDRARGRPGAFALISDALPNTLSLRLRPAANMAWRCPGCQLLLIDHGKLVH